MMVRLKVKRHYLVISRDKWLSWLMSMFEIIHYPKVCVQPIVFTDTVSKKTKGYPPMLFWSCFRETSLANVELRSAASLKRFNKIYRHQQNAILSACRKSVSFSSIFPLVHFNFRFHFAIFKGEESNRRRWHQR